MVAYDDALLERIRAFDQSRGGGVVVARVNKGYSLFSAGTGRPIARLRPTGRGDEVEVLWWRRGKWGRIGGFGGRVMPLDQALTYVAETPLFWSSA